jgi:CHAT domain-containing protein
LTWFTLSGAGREVAALSSIYRLTSGKTLFEGASATEANLMVPADSGALASFRIVHFATHGYLHPRNVLLSSVVLAEAGVGEGRSAGVDGYVTAADWLGLRLRSDLIVVAACDSGAGDAVSGEGMIGLPFGLFAASNRRTLLTLWSVYDEATAEFIRRFHAHVRAGRRFSTALAFTKREFMAGDAGADWRAPAFWAPFVLYGT